MRTLLAGLLLAAFSVHAQGTRERPEVWMMPPAHEEGRCLRELFAHPEAWRETRERIDVFCCTDLNYKKLFTDDELRGWFALLKQWNIKVGLEVGAIKPWGLTGEKTFHIEKPLWERIERLGGRIHAIAMDEPLICARRHVNQPDDYAVEETANYIALVRRHFPDVLVGDIETYPSLSVAENQWWITSLQKKLAEKKVRGLDFYRLDVDWVAFTVATNGSWKEARQIELFCRQQKLPFSLIYWASGYPALKRRGLADDATWYTAIMQQGADYALIDGRPDQYVIESWIGAPSNMIPETADFTFTRSIRDFTRKFIPLAPSD